MKRSSYHFIWLLPLVFVIGMAAAYFLLMLGGASPNLTPLASAVVGLVVALAVPLWQAWFVNAPKLAIEISSIRRTISESATISIKDDPELKILGPDRSRNRYANIIYAEAFELASGSTPRVRNGIENLDARLENAKKRLRDLPTQIEENKKDLERAQALTATNLSRHDVGILNRPLNTEVEFDPNDPQGVIDSLVKAYQDRLVRSEKEYTDLQVNLPIAERRIEVAKKDLVANKSLFTVSVSLINSGRSNTAIKAPGLLRVSIGQGNYIDIKLSLKDFENKSEISANGTRIAIFESQEISSLPEEDRDLINTYWGQSVKSWLLVEDVQGNVIRSNYIAFAEGLYQKIIYDRLARAASGLGSE